MAKRKSTDQAAEAAIMETAEKDEAAANEAAAEQATSDEEVMISESEIIDQAQTQKETGESEVQDEPEVVNLMAQLEQVRQEAAQNLERWQRAAAELANFKRRQEEQRKLQRDQIKAEVLDGVIGALDDVDLAFQNVPEDLDGQLIGWVEGFRLVQRKLDRILDDQNVMPISTNGIFDPNLHEAVSYEESEAHEEGEIIGELRKGYQIGSRVIRPALVRVAK